MRRAFGSLLLLALACPARADDATGAPPPSAEPATAEPPPDVFGEVVREAGLAPSDLGFRAKGTWNRFPNPPYEMPFFDDLLGDATSTYEFARTLGNTVEDLLTPERLRAAPDEGAPEALFRLAVALGTERRIGGFRGFGFGLLGAGKPGPDPLRTALTAMWTASGAAPPPLHDTAGMPLDLQYPLAQLIGDLASAHAWIERGLRRVTPEQRAQVFDLLRTLPGATPDATAYFPVVEDVARALDEHSLAYGCLIAVAAVARARRGLERALASAAEASAGADYRETTPFGSVVVLRGARDASVFFPEPPFLLVDLSRTPRSVFPGMGSTGATRSLSAAILMNGDEREVTIEEGETVPADPRSAPGRGTQGVARGVLGCGIVYSAGDTRNVYRADAWSLGAGLFGMGVLVDEGGDDRYEVGEMGEGAAYFGAGLLLDAAGNDTYVLKRGDGQGHGGPNGIGVLADRSGNDHYYAEPLPAKAGMDRADYHSDQKIVSSNAQGAGFGRRGDVSDGHAWAGGLGALIDVDGDDVYEAGNFSQGCGYWFGTGLLWDGGGNDVYRSVYFSHGSGAHFAVGAVIDEGGDDQHLLMDWPKVGLGPKAGAGIGFGWDVVNALCLDRAGDDLYVADVISLGCAEVRSHGWLIDESGDDDYMTDGGSLAFGAIDELPTYSVPHRSAPFAFHLPQTGLLLDLGGSDRYLRRGAGRGASDGPGAGAPVSDARAGDGRSWGKDGARGPGGGPNVARGRDVPRGRIGFLDAWPRRRSVPGSK